MRENIETSLRDSSGGLLEVAHSQCFGVSKCYLVSDINSLVLYFFPTLAPGPTATIVEFLKKWLPGFNST